MRDELNIALALFQHEFVLVREKKNNHSEHFSK